MIAALTGALADAADPETARQLAGYFQVRPGGYGEGDEFLGIRMPQLRRLVRPWLRTRWEAEEWLPHLRHEIHEHRMAALMVMGTRMERAGGPEKTEIYQTYLDHTDYVNNWDLVDESSRRIVGEYLLTRDTTPLDRLAASESLWERRIAMVATFQFLRAGRSAETYRIAETLLADDHDLIHKAVGWMLREAGKRVDPDELRSWLEIHAAQLPRTALRYAIELFDREERQRWLGSARPHA